MLPTAITLSNYRSFASPVRLELRPITLLFGDNNSGKSSLLRALPLLSDSTPSGSGPLDLESPAVRGSSFQDLRWKGLQEDEDPDLGIGVCWKGGERAEYRLTWFDEWRRLVIRHFSLWRGEHLELEASWVPVPDERSSRKLTYDVHIPGHEPLVRSQLQFFGLVPRSLPESHSFSPLLNPPGDRLQDLNDEVQWLMATRRITDPVYPYPTAPRWRMKPDGSDAPSILAGDPESLAHVSSWYEQTLRRRLRVQDVPPGRFRLMLQHLDRAILETDLVENGEGSIQVLPVLTALALMRRDAGPRILAIEEPESHLHPSLQRALAEHICDVAAESPSSRIVLETHSEHMLLGVQLQILKGTLRPEDVLVYWVRQLENGESIAEPVTLDAEARPHGDWPPGVFSQDTDMAREIVQARRERAQA